MSTPLFEITQAGINSLNTFDVNGNTPVANFGYCNVFNVDPATFNKTIFKSFTTVVQQLTYLADTSHGCRDGYATPPNFPYIGQAVPLNRVGNVGTTLANQPALRINKRTIDQVDYLHQLPTTYGDYYFNLLVVYNTYGVSDANKPTKQDMPIAFIYMFNGMQFKSQSNAIEIQATIQYSGIGAKIEYPINPITTASFLEIASVDLLPTPQAALSNVYLIRNTDPSFSEINNSTIATLNTADTVGGDNQLLWRFDGLDFYEDTTVISYGSASPTMCGINSYNTSYNGGYLQVLDGIYKGQVREILYWIKGTRIQWDTPFATAIPVGTTVRIHLRDKLILALGSTPSQDDITYNNALRTYSIGNKPNALNRAYVYDGWGSDNLKPYPTTNLNTIPSTNANANYLIQATVNTNKPADFISGYGFLTVIKDISSGYARQTLKSLNANDSLVWERTVKLSDSSATPWLNSGYSYTDIDAYNYSYTLPGGLTVKGGKVVCDHNGIAYTFTGLGHSNFATKCYNVLLTYVNTGASNSCFVSAWSTTGFSIDNNNTSADPEVFWEAKGK